MIRSLARLSFRSKIFLGITAVILIFGLFSAVFVSQVATRAILSEIKKRGLSLGLSLATRTADPLLAQDFLRLKNMVDEVQDSSDDIIYAFIQDKKGQVLSHTFPAGFPVELLDANQVPPGESQHIQLLDTEDERVYDFAVPVTVGPERIGMVRIGLSQIKAQAAVSRLLYIIFGVSAGAAMVAILLGTIFADTVTRRLDLLRKSADDIVKGNLDLQTGPQSLRSCWEIQDCSKTQCPAYGDRRRRCWFLAGTMCPECSPGGYERKIEACQNCKVFKEISGDEIQTLAETFDYMALSLSDHIEGLKAAEKVLTRQQQLLKTMLDVTPDLVSLQDSNLVYKAANQSFLTQFDLQEQEIIGKTDLDIFPAERADIIRAEDLEIISTGIPLSKEIIIRKGRKKHWFHMVKVPVRDDDRVVGLLLTARDITEIKQYQEKLVQSVKMEELGKLAGGVAHEINTPLGIILGYAQMLLEDLPHDEESHEFLEIIEKQVKICRRIVADLLSFSRVSEGRKEQMDLNQSITEVLQLLEHIFKQNWVDIETSLEPGLPPIRGDKEKLKQVWLNLLNNAFESIGKDGTIWVKTSLCPFGNHVFLTVADSGAGIEPMDIKKIFDPFFSTKAPGVGTGLGLSVSYGIVKEHEGKIMAVSPSPPEYRTQAGETNPPPGPGALFLVKLPINWENPVEDACEQYFLHQEPNKISATG
jgi:two-component system NtrC family sensor kinase